MYIVEEIYIENYSIDSCADMEVKLRRVHNSDPHFIENGMKVIRVGDVVDIIPPYQNGEQLALVRYPHEARPLKIEKIIFNGPATIVFWSDYTKMVLKQSEDDIYDPEKAIAIAIAYKKYGKSNFKKLVKEYAEAAEEQHDEQYDTEVNKLLKKLRNYDTLTQY